MLPLVWSSTIRIMAGVQGMQSAALLTDLIATVQNKTANLSSFQFCPFLSSLLQPKIDTF